MTPTTKKKFLEFEPDDYQMEDGETRVYIDPKSLKGIYYKIGGVFGWYQGNYIYTSIFHGWY